MATTETDERRSILKWVGIAEATSFLVLLAFMTWHRGFEGPDMASFTGPVHGSLFLAYVALVFMVRKGAGWSGWETLVLLGAAVVPFGGFLVASRLEGEAAESAATPAV